MLACVGSHRLSLGECFSCKAIPHISLPQENLLKKEDKEDIELEIQRIEKQLERGSPKKGIMHQALGVIYNIASSIAANALTSPVLESLSNTMKLLQLGNPV